MKLEILSVKGRGDHTQESVRLKVIDDCDLKHYMVADTTYTGDTTISNRVRHTHWFKPGAVKQGDFVWLYTGPGKNTTRGNDSGSTTHVRYWGLNKAVWNDEGDCALLFQIATWRGKRVQ
ncbi:hypothetical protein SAMN05216571_10813 [Onishia taeanensis]|uniref:Uncharacterized protein n=2 Tax=Onishia taeanensis TaxID=284577 RepID=A0A1G7SWA4_9GAMM|nr:hypothetical protein SAMN05216571_10813 [Halomonas taeanensis]